ncbi:MAG: hypothetical protein ACI85K_001788 [Hyphomicrobiaceae bacterium]|jgi:hypothetical protein
MTSMLYPLTGLVTFTNFERLLRRSFSAARATLPRELYP